MSKLLDTITTTLLEDIARMAALLVTLVGIVYLVATHQQVPQELWSILTLVLGYYFGRGVTNHLRSK